MLPVQATKIRVSLESLLVCNLCNAYYPNTLTASKLLVKHAVFGFARLNGKSCNKPVESALLELLTDFRIVEGLPFETF